MAVDVRTPVFEGPFDLLLHLITNQQVDIHDVSLAAIVDGFVAELEGLGRVELEVSSEFLLIAAILIELKAKRLLPVPEGVDLDDELGLWEERDLLLAKLLECKTFKDAAAVLGLHMLAAERSFPRRAGVDERYATLVPDPLAGTSPDRLRKAFLRAMAPKPVAVLDLSHVTSIKVSVADTIAELCHELPRSGPITFRRLTGQLAERITVVVHFLAVLELYKQGLVDLQQASTFGELTISWIGTDRAAALALVGASDAYEG